MDTIPEKEPFLKNMFTVGERVQATVLGMTIETKIINSGSKKDSRMPRYQISVPLDKLPQLTDVEMQNWERDKDSWWVYGVSLKKLQDTSQATHDIKESSVTESNVTESTEIQKNVATKKAREILAESLCHYDYPEQEWASYQGQNLYLRIADHIINTTSLIQNDLLMVKESHVLRADMINDKHGMKAALEDFLLYKKKKNKNV